MSDFDKNENQVQPDKLPRIEDLSEDQIYKMIQEDMENIEPPESLSPANIEKRLQGVKQRKSSGAGRKWLYAAGLAACLALGAMTGIITYSLIKGDDSVNTHTEVATENQTAPGNTAPKTGDPDVVAELGYDDVCNIINGYNQRENERNDYYKYDDMVEEAIPEEVPAAGAEAEEASSDFAQTTDSANEAAGASRGEESSDYSRTDEQVAGVEEGDIVKTNGKYIFTVEASTFGYTLHIIKPNGNQSTEAGSLEIKAGRIDELYIYNDMAVLIGAAWAGYTGFDEIDSYNTGDSSRIKTVITFVDFSNPAYPTVVKRHTQTGYFNTSRISDGFLYTFTEDVYMGSEYDPDRPWDYIPLVDAEPMAESKLSRVGEEDTNNYMVMTSISLKNPESFTDTLAVLGGGATYYMSTNNIYIARPANNTSGYNGMIYSGSNMNEQLTTITRFSYTGGYFSKKASTAFRGMINNSYYMHEYQGHFIFVYTAYDDSWQEYNGLCILDENLDKTGELTRIAPGERIYSSYYIDNMAYFVTYRNTDPVFAVDISDPHRPVLKSELKLPGFSSYLHSFGPDMLLGIGYGDSSKDGSEWDNTAKLSLFGISDNYSITELSKTFGEQYDTHIADRNHKAIFVDEQRGLVGLGLMNYTRVNEDSNLVPERYVVYQLQGKKLVEVLDTGKDKNFEPVNIYDMRGVRIGETFYVCNSSGVLKAYSISTDGKAWKEA